MHTIILHTLCSFVTRLSHNVSICHERCATALYFRIFLLCWTSLTPHVQYGRRIRAHALLMIEKTGTFNALNNGWFLIASNFYLSSDIIRISCNWFSNKCIYKFDELDCIIDEKKVRRGWKFSREEISWIYIKIIVL